MGINLTKDVQEPYTENTADDERRPKQVDCYDINSQIDL